MKHPAHPFRQTFLTGAMLFLAGLCVFGAAAVLLRAPGYMDAEYYYLGGRQLFRGDGFTEMVLWNYLDDPQGLPHSSHSYWLPLTSLLAAAGMLLCGSGDFLAAQLPFILIAAAIPVLVYHIALMLHNRQHMAVLAGVLALLSGFYLPYQATTSTLGPYMLQGGLYFGLLVSLWHTGQGRAIGWKFLLLGLLAGSMALTRSDGVLWLAGGLGAALAVGLSSKFASGQARSRFLQTGKWAVCVLAGFLAVTSLWYIHNLSRFGQVMPGGGSTALWMTDYNQMFSYPPEKLTFSTWLSSGFAEILSIRLKSSLQNLLTLTAVEGQIVLLPLLAVGFWRFRKMPPVALMAGLWLLTFLLMSIVFPFAGMRGGFLHSSAAFQPMIWCLVPAGFERFIAWGVRKRNWHMKNAWRNFAALLGIVLAIFTAGVFITRVVGSNFTQWNWTAGWRNYSQIEQKIRQDFPDPDTVIVVNNPPGYTLASGGRPAVVLPNGDEQSLLAVIEKFQAGIVAVDKNTVDGLSLFYEQPLSTPELEYLYTINDTRIYRVRADQ